MDSDCMEKRRLPVMALLVYDLPSFCTCHDLNELTRCYRGVEPTKTTLERTSVYGKSVVIGKVFFIRDKYGKLAEEHFLWARLFDETHGLVGFGQGIHVRYGLARGNGFKFNPDESAISTVGHHEPSTKCLVFYNVPDFFSVRQVNDEVRLLLGVVPDKSRITRAALGGREFSMARVFFTSDEMAERAAEYYLGRQVATGKQGVSMGGKLVTVRMGTFDHSCIPSA